ncbi:MAG: efflux RND transporter periplasmic adaptor subunit [bacterium]|nr:efflux RND transporter periplasmic adaptor subunit [bacterium]
MIRKYWWLVAFVVLLTLIVWWRLQKQEGSTNLRRQTTPVVKTNAPQRKSIVNSLTYTGDVFAVQQASINSKVTGSLASVLVDIGDHVRAGQLLAVIDTSELAQQHLQALATYRNAKQTFDRTQELFERKLSSQQERDNAEAAFQVAQANYEVAKVRLGYSQIAAPFTGVITKRSQDLGAVIVANTTSIFTLMDVSTVKAIVNVLEKDVSQIKPGMNAVIRTDAYPDKTFLGKVNRLSSALDPASRTMPVEIQVPNPGELLKPGMYVKATIDIEIRENVLTIPPQAIQRNGDRCFVYVIENQTAKRRQVTIGKELETETEIVEGISESDNVAIVGVQFLRDGGNVNLQR